MSQGEASAEIGTGASQSIDAEAQSDRSPGAVLRQVAERAAGSRAAAGAAGIASVLGGLRALRRGKRGRGLAGLAVGAFLMRRVLTWGRTRSGGDVDRQAVAEAGDVGAVEQGAGSPEPDAAESAGAGESDAVGRGPEEEPSAGETVETVGRFERLGGAAIDGESLRVPAPQPAFDRGYLVQGGEAHWGVRESDDAALVTSEWDSLQDAEGVRYVASSEVEADGRLLRVPDDVLDHWDDVAGGGTAVAGGDGLVFLTTSELAGAGQLRVVPGQWMAQLMGEEEP